MTLLEIILIGALALENIILLIALVVKHNKNKNGIKIKDGVRYTTTSTIKTDEKAVNISFNEKDVVLVADKVYTVGKDAEVKPGK